MRLKSLLFTADSVYSSPYTSLTVWSHGFQRVAANGWIGIGLQGACVPCEHRRRHRWLLRHLHRCTRWPRKHWHCSNDNLRTRNFRDFGDSLQCNHCSLGPKTPSATDGLVGWRFAGHGNSDSIDSQSVLTTQNPKPVGHGMALGCFLCVYKCVLSKEV